MRPRFALFAAVMASTGCDKGPVQWSDVAYSDSVSGIPAALPAVAVPDSAACVSSVREFVTGAEKHLIWWSVRPDSSGILKYTSIRNDSTGPTVSMDTTDSSRRGCKRPAPALAADDQGRVYAAYFLEAASGPGIFFVHKMDSIGFHDPISISYGKRPSEVSLTVEGDRIAVAYEEPNSERGQIWVALSNSMGHLFEYRGSVSGPSEIARHPAVNLNGMKLDISWLELIQSDSSGRLRRALRTGIWK